MLLFLLALSQSALAGDACRRASNEGETVSFEFPSVHISRDGEGGVLFSTEVADSGQRGVIPRGARATLALSGGQSIQTLVVADAQPAHQSLGFHVDSEPGSTPPWTEWTVTVGIPGDALSLLAGAKIKKVTVELGPTDRVYRLIPGGYGKKYQQAFECLVQVP